MMLVTMGPWSNPEKVGAYAQYSHYLDRLCLRSTSNFVHFGNKYPQALKLELQSFLLRALEWNQYLLLVWRTKLPKSIKKRNLASCWSVVRTWCWVDYWLCGRIYGVAVNHRVMAPPDNDIHDGRCAINHYYASFPVFLIKIAVGSVQWRHQTFRILIELCHNTVIL